MSENVIVQALERIQNNPEEKMINVLHDLYMRGWDTGYDDGYRTGFDNGRSSMFAEIEEKGQW